MIRHIKEIERFRASKEVKLELILPAEVLMSLVRVKVMGILVIPDIWDKVSRVKEMYFVQQVQN